jgi:hypothetical protein
MLLLMIWVYYMQIFASVSDHWQPAKTCQALCRDPVVLLPSIYWAVAPRCTTSCRDTIGTRFSERRAFYMASDSHPPMKRSPPIGVTARFSERRAFYMASDSHPPMKRSPPIGVTARFSERRAFYMASDSHPPMKRSPPIGVTGPSNRGPPRASPARRPTTWRR